VQTTAKFGARIINVCHYLPQQGTRAGLIRAINQNSKEAFMKLGFQSLMALKLKRRTGR
jgi:hypothetical protein